MGLRKGAAWALVTLLAASTAAPHAEGTDETWDPPPVTREDLMGEKLLAIGLSLGATVLPVAAAYALSQVSSGDGNNGTIATLALGGLLIGPSTGQFYAESPGLGLLGVGIRTAGAVVVGAGIATAVGEVLCGFDSGDEPGNGKCAENGDWEALVLTGIAVYGAGATLSLATIPWAIDRKHRRRRASAWQWTPTLALAPGGAIRPGAMLRLGF